MSLKLVPFLLDPEVLPLRCWVVCVWVVVREELSIVHVDSTVFLIREQINEDAVSKPLLCNLNSLIRVTERVRSLLGEWGSLLGEWGRYWESGGRY